MMRILLVDDDLDVLDIYAELLQQEGFSVTCAHDGEEALARATRGSPDLIITDGAMPRMDGFELCDRLHEDPGLRRVPVLIHSSEPNVRPAHGETFVPKARPLPDFLDCVHHLLPEEDAPTPCSMAHAA